MKNIYFRGYSLIELMIVLVIAGLMMFGLTLLYQEQHRARTELEKNSEQIENGRYASAFLEREIRVAGYFGRYVPDTSGGTAFGGSTTITAASSGSECLTTAAALQSGILQPVTGVDSPSSALSATCYASADMRIVTGNQPDVLVIRRTSSVAETGATFTAGYTYIQTTPSSVLIKTPSDANYRLSTTYTLTNKDGTKAPIYKLYTRIFYIAANDIAGDGIPTLKMIEPTGPSGTTPVAIAEGIESMQIDYGIDCVDCTTNPPDGAVEAYVTAPGNWTLVRSVRINILARNLRSTSGYTDTRTYRLGGAISGSVSSSGSSIATTATDVGPFNDSFKRHVFSLVVPVNNLIGRGCDGTAKTVAGTATTGNGYCL